MGAFQRIRGGWKEESKEKGGDGGGKACVARLGDVGLVSLEREDGAIGQVFQYRRGGRRGIASNCLHAQGTGPAGDLAALRAVRCWALPLVLGPSTAARRGARLGRDWGELCLASVSPASL